MRSSPGDPIFHRPPLTRPLLSLRCRFLVSHSPSSRTSEIVLPGTIPLSTRSVTSPANRPERLQKGVYQTHCTHWCLAWISGRSMIPSARTSKWQQPPATNHPPSNKMTSDKLPAPKCTTRKTLPVFLSGCQTVFRSNPLRANRIDQPFVTTRSQQEFVTANFTLGNDMVQSLSSRIASFTESADSASSATMRGIP